MTDAFGAVEIPTAPGGGDPGLASLLGFCAAVLNAECGAAWAALRPRPTGDTEGTAVVRTAHAVNPEEGQFAANDLPALFVWRLRGQQEDMTHGWRAETARFQLLWILPPDRAEKWAARKPFVNAAMKALGAAISQGRHPAWVHAADLADVPGRDPKAATLPADDDAIVVERATSTSATTLAGAGLDGAIGSGPMSPRRGLTLTLAPAEGAYDPDQPIVVTYLDWLETTRTVAIRPTTTDGGETLSTTIEARQVLAVDIPAQMSADGALRIGVQARDGYGSVLLERAALMRLELAEWAPHILSIDVMAEDGRVDRTLRYHGALATIVGLEQHVEDPAARTWPFASPPAGVDIDVNLDGFNASSAALPDDAA